MSFGVFSLAEGTKLKCVPVRFESVEEYIGVFEPLIFEECRAKLRAEWEELNESSSGGEHIEVTIKCVKKRRGGWYVVTVDPTENCNWTFKDGDVAILSSLKPRAGRLKRKNPGAIEDNMETTFGKRMACTIWGQKNASSRKVAAPMLYYFAKRCKTLSMLFGGYTILTFFGYLVVIPSLPFLVIVGLSEVDRIEDFDGENNNDNCIKEINPEGDGREDNGNNGEDNGNNGEDDDNKGEDDQILRRFKLNEFWYLTVLGSLVTTEREYNALHAFHSFNPKMKSTILNPNPDQFAKYEEEQPPAMDECLTSNFVDYLQKSFSGPQLLSIRWAAMHRSKEQDPWPFTLVQGPPGTGKTHTVWGILNVFHELYQTEMRKKLAAEICVQIRETVKNSCENMSMEFVDGGFQGTDENHIGTLPQKPKILVCAPSNAATDELLVRVLDRGFIDCEMKVYHPDVVRVGVGSQTHAAQVVSVERRTEQILVNDSDAITSLIEQLSVQEAQLSEEIDSLKKELIQDHYNDSLLHKLVASLDEKRKLLVGKDRISIVQRYSLKTITRGVAREMIEASFLDEADIVFTTVSSSGCKLFSRLTRGFDMVIIDEAAQANEVGVLPPLVTSASRCVLVGDHHQLSATIISKEARNLLYGRSLFERFQQVGCPSLLLSIQYRMHPQIRDFPSRYFYQGRLTDGEILRTLPDEIFHEDPLLRPYLFFDITNGRESHRGDSVSYENIQEARFCLRLYEYLQRKLKSLSLSKVSVGIITPYKLQMKCIEREFKEVLKSKEGKDLYINTVDAFQGQERGVIIMSCVRTSDRGVGFVADAQRMNVALTRAKRALWVIGNANALAKSDDWANLIADAKLRACFLYLESLPTEFVTPNRHAQEFPNRPEQEFPNRHTQQLPNRPPQQFQNRHAQEFPDRPPQQFPNRHAHQSPNRPAHQFPNRPGQQFPSRPAQQFPKRPLQQFSNRPQQIPKHPLQQFPNRPVQQFPKRPAPFLAHARRWCRTEPD
ncbi:hypothetical protein GIB67_026026 [Kingdonia uniflora]|uniref:Uncharacterized protein n=1 Tax=Kingdonia uniflora TaxID=39325 RepID=A0A7J7M2W0_9MAGN|nr:hypothetical protein GIB67_026026 [Kingdonia uniflora]